MSERKSLLLILAAIILTIVQTSVSAAPADAIVYVDPAVTYAIEGEAFYVDINVDDVTNLYGWQVRMSFNSSVVAFVNVTEGEFLMDQPEGTTGELRIENEEGYALFSWLTVGKYDGVDGSGTLATAEFLTLTRGESILNITSSHTYLQEMASVAGGYIPQKIPCTLENGFVSSLYTPPMPDFTYSPEMPQRNEAITFNASASDDEDGYIVSYLWDFGDETPAVNETDPIATHTYTTGGAKTITLSVTDDTGLSKSKSSEIWIKFAYDVAVTDVDLSSTRIDAGEPVSIDVTVANRGDETVSFDVVVYYGAMQIDTKAVNNLAPDTESTLGFSWNTEGVTPDNYVISAEADFDGDEYPDDNLKGAGTITVDPLGAPFPMELVIVAVVVIVVVVGAGAFLLMRKRGS